MASINNCNNTSSGAGGTNMYRVGDYVYFDIQQQQQTNNHPQPFQIRRIEELNKTADGNVEAKVMCFYRRRDLPPQLVVLADKHQQQQISLNLSLSSDEKNSGKHTPAIKALLTTDKITDQKEQDSGILSIVKKEQLNAVENKESAKTLEEKQQSVEKTESAETDSTASAISKEIQEVNYNDKIQDSKKDDDIKTVQHNLWWRSEQLKQRELFLSRQVELLAVTNIRGKCTVSLFNETESLDSYLNKDDTFFYCLVFDPVQKTLLADKGEIRVGLKYQAEVPPKALLSLNSSDSELTIKEEIIKEKNKIINSEEKLNITESSHDDHGKNNIIKSLNTVIASDSDFETLIWTCNPQWNRLTDRQIDQFLVVSRSLGTFARALDCSSSVKQPSLHMSAAAASRDITLFHAMDTLHKHGYDLGAATCSLVPSTGPVLCHDEMEDWSASEANLFEEALEKYGKDFGDIRHDFLPWKTHKNIVEYYYMWKTTDRYVQQKRIKAVEQESKLKHVYIPTYNGISTSGLKQNALPIKYSQQLVNGNSGAIELYSPKNSGGDRQLLPGVCDLCDVVVSRQWFPNTMGITSVSYQQNGGVTPAVLSSTLCYACWTHWKKYCGPRIATLDEKVITIGRGDEDRPHSNASSSSMNQNLDNRSSHTPTLSAPSHHHHHLMNLGGSDNHSNYLQQQQQQFTTSPSSELLLHQPHIKTSGSSSITHRCTIIGCQAIPFKNKSHLLRHYSVAHGIGGVNSNNSNNTLNIVTSVSSHNRTFGNDSFEDNNIGKISPQPPQNNSSGSNLNSSNKPIQHSNMISGNVNQVINLVASSSSPQQQPNNLSISGGDISNNNNTITATGRPVMKTRTAFYLRCTSLAKASRRQASQQAASKKIFNSSVMLSSPSSLTQPGCLARPRNVARRPFICVPQTAHAYKHECMLSLQHAPVHELKTYLRAVAIKAHARRPGVTRVANSLIAARRGRGGINATTATDLAVPDWLTLPSQHQSSHHHVSKHSKHSSKSGRVAFPKPPKAPDGSLLYERVPNKQETATAAAFNNPSAAVTAAGLNPAATTAILGALGSSGSTGSGSTGASGLSNDLSISGFDVAVNQPQSSSSYSSSNKRRLYETDGAAATVQPQPQVGPPSKRMHRQQYSQLQHSATSHHHNQQQQQHHQSSPSSLGAGGGAVDGMLASLVAHQQQQQKRGGSAASGGSALQLTGSGKSSRHQQAQQHSHYRTPSMARTGRKHVISWTDAPDDLYYRCTALSKSLRKARMTGRELRRSARKPWQQIVALLGISFSMPPTATSIPAVAPGTTGSTAVTGLPTQQLGTSSSISGTPFDMSTGGSRQLSILSSNNQSSTVSIPVPQSVNSSRTSHN